MLQLSTFFRQKWLSAGLLFLLTTTVAAPRAFGQTAMVGYTSIAGGTPPTSPYAFLSAANSDTVLVVPFAFNSLGNYTLTSTSLVLRSFYHLDGDPPAGSDLPGGPGGEIGHEPPPTGGGVGDIDLDLNVSLRIFSTLPTSLALPTSFVTYAPKGYGASTDPAIYTFNVNSAPTFTAGVTYYMALSLTGTLEWDMTTGDSSVGTFPGDNPVTSLVDDGAPLVYYKVTPSGVESFYGNAGGFAIAANAVSAIPEPATVGVLSAGCVLAVAVMARGRRRRFAMADEALKAGG